MDISVARSRKSTQWKPKEVTWEELIAKLSKPIVTSETYDEYMKMSKDKQDAIKDKGGFVGGKLKDGSRRKGHVEHRELLCLDMDYGTADFWEEFKLLFNYTCCIHTTHKHSVEKPRYRLIFPIARPVTEEEYEAVARNLAQQIGIDLFDDTTYEPTRLMYWPTVSKEGTFFCKHMSGECIDPDKLLATYENWKDCSQWPKSSRVKRLIKHDLKILGDPTQKEGIIGDFCKAYTISRAIDKFLSHIYEPCTELGPNRYTYVGGSTSGGAIVYNDMYLYSYHSTDPAQAGSHNSFDLVRIHLFGEIDEGSIAKNPPSMKEMLTFASNDEQVRAASNEELVAAFGDAEAEAGVESAIYYNTKGVKCLDIRLFAKFVREHSKYMIVRKQGQDSEFLYWYDNGVYKWVGSNEFKGKLKRLLPDEFCTPRIWEEVYKHIITDCETIKFEDLDKDETYINFRNGLYNIDTRQLEPHSSNLLSTMQFAIDYNPHATKPSVWLKFVETLGNNDPELIAIMQEWIGLVASNVYGTRVKKCLVLVSEIGNTGKTQFIKLLANLIGYDKVCSTPIQKMDKTFGLGSLYGSKAIIIDDQTDATIEDITNFKQVTGSGPVNCEMKGKQAFSYDYRGTLTFACNDLPYFKGDKGNHVFDRFMIIPCRQVISKEERNTHLLDECMLELEGIMLWALEGLERLKARQWKFTHSDASAEALHIYRGRNDSLYKFVRENYQVTEDEADRILKTKLEKEYEAWCHENDVIPIKRRNIADRARKQGIFVKRSNGIYYTHIKAL
ncbi:MAG: phage/plasmid primase, P4 family [Niameybacter sp.]